MSSTVINWLFILFYVILNASGALIIKHKVNQIGNVNLDSLLGFIKYFYNIFLSPVIIFGLFLIFLSAVSWIAALSRMEISNAYPIATGLNFLIIVLTALIFMGESMNFIKFIGIILLMLSFYILTKY